MKKSLILISIFLLSSITLISQIPDTDIFLIDIIRGKTNLEFGKPVNITDRPGYDNQPSFSSDNTLLYYVQMQDTIQTDIISYDIAEKISTKTAETPESEYSPVFAGGDIGYSVVRVDMDKAQRLYKYLTTPANAELVFEGIDSVGYYKWINDSTVALVVLNNGLELYVYEIYTGQFIVAAKNVGRCLLTDPASGNLIYTVHSDSSTTLMLLNLETFESEAYCDGYKGSKDYIFTPSGDLWTGTEGKLYAMKPDNRKVWTEIADFTKTVGPFYRLAMSPDGKKLALVSYKEKRP